MTGKAFIDSNVLVYAVGPSSKKRQQAEAILLASGKAVISTQVVGEFVNVCLKKQILPAEQVRQAAEDFTEVLVFSQADSVGFCAVQARRCCVGLVARCFTSRFSAALPHRTWPHPVTRLFQLD